MPLGITASVTERHTDGTSASQSWAVDPGTAATMTVNANGTASLNASNLHPVTPLPASDTWSQPLSIVVDVTCD